MISFNSLRSLEAVGIVPLTGEADGLHFRILCDYTERGRRVLADAFGLREFFGAENWNTGRAADPHVGSVLLDPSLWPLLAIFATLRSGCSEAITVANEKGEIAEVIGSPRGNDDDELQRSLETYKQFGCHLRHFESKGGQLRNEHQFTGRVH